MMTRMVTARSNAAILFLFFLSILLTTLLFSALLFSAIGANAIQNRFRFVDLKACAFQRAMQKLFRFLFSKMNAFPAYPTG